MLGGCRPQTPRLTVGAAAPTVGGMPPPDPAGRGLRPCIDPGSLDSVAPCSGTCNRPAAVKSLECEIDRNGGPLRPDFALESAQKLATKVAPPAPATFPASLWADSTAKGGLGEPLFRSILHLNDFTVAGPKTD